MAIILLFFIDFSCLFLIVFVNFEYSYSAVGIRITKKAGSALSQVQKGSQTGSQIEDLASKVLSSPKYSHETTLVPANKKLSGC